MSASHVKTPDQPVISVVVLCYNLEKYIGECLDSVVSQQIDVPFEVIVSDDGSRDASLAVIESFKVRYPHLIRIVRHEHNVGYSRNFADAIAPVRGEYIACIDGDDLMLPGKLARQYEFLETQREFGMVTHRMRTVNAMTKEPVDFPLPRVKPPVFDGEYMIENGPFFFTSSTMFRTALRKRYAVDLQLEVVADVANLLQSFHGTQARYLDEELGLYRVNPNGFTSTVIRNPARHETSIRDMMRTFEMADAMGMAKDVTDRARARLFLRSAILYLENGHYEAFERCIEASVKFARVGAKQEGLYAMRRWPRTLRPLYTFAKQMAGRQPVRA